MFQCKSKGKMRKNHQVEKKLEGAKYFWGGAG